MKENKKVNDTIDTIETNDTYKPLTKRKRFLLHLHNFWLDIKLKKYQLDYKFWDFVGKHANGLATITTVVIIVVSILVLLACLNWVVRGFISLFYHGV